MNATATGVERKPIARKRRGTVAPPNVGVGSPAAQPAAATGEEAKQSQPTTPRRSASFGVRIKADVFARLQAHRRLTGQSNTELLTEAFQTIGSDYRRLTGATANPEVGPPPRETPHKRSHRGDTKNLTIYFDGRQQEWLDQRVANGGAPSRTELIETVLDKYLQ